MSAAERQTELAPLFAALGDRTRLTLLMRLSDGRTASIVALAAETALTRQAVTKHLGVLEEVGLVAGTRQGREHRYQARPEALVTARAFLELMTARWDERLARLKAMVER